MGTTFSAPVTMLTAQAVATVRLSPRAEPLGAVSVLAALGVRDGPGLHG